MTKFGSLLKEKRRARGFTQKELSRLLSKKDIYLDASVLSRWETGDRFPGARHRKAVLAIGDALDMTEDEKNQLLVNAGLVPLQREELDLDKMLEGLGSERWRKTNFLHKEMKYDEKHIGEKLGIPFWEVQKDIERAREEEQREKQAAQPVQVGEQPPSKLKGRAIGYGRESLEKGTEVFIPPAYSVCIPLSVKAGEAITHISVSCVKGWSLDNYVDCSLSRAGGSEVENPGRILNWGGTLYLLSGEYYLALGNEFTSVEKQVLVTVKWEPETQPGDNLPPVISQFSDLRADFH